MNRSTAQKLLPPLGLLVLGGVATLLFWPKGDGLSEERPGPSAVSPGAPSVLDPGVTQPVAVPLARESTDDPSAPVVSESKATTVLYPVELHLELVRPADLPDVGTGPEFGSGRSARLTGRITTGVAARDDSTAEISFVEGTNRGRVLTTGKDGRFGALDLLPGRNIVQVTGPGLVGARREVILFDGKERLLNLSFGRLGNVHGRVQSETGADIPGARVNLDGHTTLTDAEGRFFVADVAPGMALMEIRAEGYAPLRNEVGVTHAHTIEPGHLDFRLEPSAKMRIGLMNDIGGPGPVQVTILPETPASQSDHPWYAYNPIELGAAGVVIDDLPTGRVRIRAYRAGARARPAEQILNLNPGDNNSVTIELEPAPMLRGRVERDGVVVAGARVALSAADPVQATLRHLRADRARFSQSILPLLAPARQEIVADSSGRFVLEDWSSIAPWRLLEASSPDGEFQAALAIGPEDSEVVVELSSSEERRGRLEFEFTRRTQALPVEVSINGRPYSETLLSVGEGLELKGLTEGTWKVSATFYGNRFFEEYAVEVGADSRLQVVPPIEAVEGQDRETWRRAGKPYPAVN